MSTMIMSPFCAQDAEIVAPSDTVAQTSNCRGLYVGGAGDVALVTLAGNLVLLKSVPAGSLLPIGFKRINLTNTSATFMIGLV